MTDTHIAEGADGGREAVKHTPSRLLHPFCKECGWRKGGIDSWDGNACKCGHSSTPMETGWVINGEVFEDRVTADRAYRSAIAKAEGFASKPTGAS